MPDIETDEGLREYLEAQSMEDLIEFSISDKIGMIRSEVILLTKERLINRLMGECDCDKK